MPQPINPITDRLYNNRAAVPDHQAIFARWRSQSAATRAALVGNVNCHLNLHYGADAKQTVDLFPASANRGLVVFIHGGYWRSLDKDDFSFLAAPYIAEGINVALMNYRLCPQVGVSDIVDDCRNAIIWLANHASEFSVRFDRTVLVGHSAGAHLVAMLFTTDWSAIKSEISSAIIGGVAISGLYDLEPLLETTINHDVKLDVKSAANLSPVHRKPTLNASLDAVVGADETSEFIRQTELLPLAWPQLCPAIGILPAHNHFTIVDHFADPSSAAFQRSLALFS